jgi:PAS domain S-box-containing protein
MSALPTVMIIYCLHLLVIFFAFLHLYHLNPRRFFLFWTLGWLALFLRIGFDLICYHYGAGDLWPFLDYFSNGLNSVLFFWGGLLFVGRGKKAPLLYGCFGMVFLGSIVAAFGAGNTFTVHSFLYLVFLAVLNMFIGMLLLTHGRTKSLFGACVLGMVFIIWGADKVLQPILYVEEIHTPYGYVLAGVLAFMMAFFMILLLVEGTRQELARSEEKWRRFFEKASDAMYVFDPHTGHFLDANAKAQEMSGYAREELLQLSLADLHPETDKDIAPAVLQDYMKRKIGEKTEDIHKDRSKNGSVRTVSVTRSVVDYNGREAILATVRDISEKYRVEEEIYRQLQRVVALNKISNALSSTLKSEELYQIILDQVSQVIPTDAFFIDLYDEEKRRTRGVFYIDTVNGQKTRVSPPGSGSLQSIMGEIYEPIILKKRPLLELREPGAMADSNRRPFGDVARRSASLMYVPMISQDRVVGVMSAQSYQHNVYDQSQLDFLANIANMAAAAIENAHLFQAEQDQADKMRFISELSQLINATFETKEVFQKVYELLPTYMKVSRATILLYDPAIKKLVDHEPRADSQSGQVIFAEPQDSYYSIAGLCFSTARPIVENDCRASKIIPQQWVNALQLKSTVAVPIISRKGAIGVLRVDDCETQGRFTQEHVEFLELVAQQLSVALENSQLYNTLKHSEQKYSHLVEHCNAGIVIIQNERFQYVNKTFLCMIGYPLDELMERDVFEFLAPEDREILRHRYGERLKGHDVPSHYSFRMLRKDGSRIYVEADVSQVQFGEEQATMAVVRDITEKKQMEQKLMQVERMRSIGTLAGGLASDFNNIFGLILSQTSYLKMILEPGVKIYPYVESIEEATTRAVELTKQLLAFARAGKYEIGPVNVNTIVEESLRAVQAILDSNIIVQTQLAPAVWTVNADAEQLQKVLTGIYINAQEAMHGNGRMAVNTENVELDERILSSHPDCPPGKYVAITVTDTGIGMSREVMEHIFDPFFSTKERTKWPGLGLSLAYGIARSHGGFISVESEINQGSSFTIYLPAIDTLVSD